jgi:hypothetical protein
MYVNNKRSVYIMFGYEEECQNCDECYHRNYCKRKNKTFEGKYCLYFNVINKPIIDWCNNVINT